MVGSWTVKEFPQMQTVCLIHLRSYHTSTFPTHLHVPGLYALPVRAFATTQQHIAHKTIYTVSEYDDSCQRWANGMRVLLMILAMREIQLSNRVWVRKEQS
ncbi:hypothetical protein HASA104033_08385 [Halobacterium salinarum]|uniref:Uncharacterized protein n=1 Tax=Halobacterium salinarum (strain ATCC 33171 / DSM 3754 / JCM 8978 / NBRC 102687 / NCIMB 764 / 91-R6) TaxID=2597657 RepID=A0A663A642_HALS9|nr:hypothetical protein APQ99_02191 [Halobacterium salinarum DSM 3754]